MIFKAGSSALFRYRWCESFVIGKSFKNLLFTATSLILSGLTMFLNLNQCLALIYEKAGDPTRNFSYLVAVGRGGFTPTCTTLACKLSAFAGSALLSTYLGYWSTLPEKLCIVSQVYKIWITPQTWFLCEVVRLNGHKLHWKLCILTCSVTA